VNGLASAFLAIQTNECSDEFLHKTKNSFGLSASPLG